MRVSRWTDRRRKDRHIMVHTRTDNHGHFDSHDMILVLGAHESPIIYHCSCRMQETHGLWSTWVLGKSCVEYWKVCLMHKYRWIFDNLPIKQIPYFSRIEIYKIFNIVFWIDIQTLLSFCIQSIYVLIMPTIEEKLNGIKYRFLPFIITFEGNLPLMFQL